MGISGIERQIEGIMGRQFRGLEGSRTGTRFVSNNGIGIFLLPEGVGAKRMEIIHFGTREGKSPPPDIELVITKKEQVVTNPVPGPKNVQIKDTDTGQEVTIYADGQVVHRRIDVRV